MISVIQHKSKYKSKFNFELFWKEFKFLGFHVVVVLVKTFPIYYVPQPFFRKLYQTMIYPHLNYGIEIKGNSCKMGIKRLQRIQNKGIIIISSTNMCKPSDYDSLKLMSFKHIHEYFSLIRFFKYYKLNESQNIKMKIKNQQTNHSYSTSHSMALNLNCPNLRLRKLKTSF